MDRHEEIEKSYKLLGNAGSVYDGIVTYLTPVGKLINKMMWGFNKETTAEWMNSAMSGIPDNFKGKLLEVPIGTGVLTMPLYKNLPDADITCLDYSSAMIRRVAIIAMNENPIGMKPKNKILKVTDASGKKRCFWCNLKNPAYIAYHDEEWGVPCHDEQKLYEMFLLETFQAGLSWECILNKRENFRRAYDGFNLEKVCAYDEDKLQELLQDPGIIRNKAKLKASISNSKIYRDIKKEFDGFDAYLKTFTDGKAIREPDVSITTSPLSDALSADLKKRRMTFVGSTTIYAYLQAIGVINAHQMDCFRYAG